MQQAEEYILDEQAILDDFSKTLHTIAEELDVNQSKMGGMCGQDRQNFNPVYNGKKNCSLITLKRISNGTGESAQRLVAFLDKKNYLKKKP